MEGCDYIKAFSNLKGDNSMNARQKAILLFAIMDLVAQDIIRSNEILYNEDLEKAYKKDWEKFIGVGSYDSHYAAKAFWCMYGEPFWHIITKSNSTNVLQLMADNNIKPSKSEIVDSVKYAMLDEDLYFLLTLPSSRKDFKRTLLSSYTNLDEKEIESNVEENYDMDVISDPNELFNSLKVNKESTSALTDDAEGIASSVYDALTLDEKIELNLSYFTFLKQHHAERHSFLQHFPSVKHLCEAIYNNTISRENSDVSFIDIYSAFLYNLKYALMSLPNASELIDRIIETTGKLENLEPKQPSSDEFIIDDSDQNEEEPTPKEEESVIQQNYHRLNAEWTEREESVALVSYVDGVSVEEIASKLQRTTEDVESFIDNHQDEIKDLQSRKNLLSENVQSEEPQEDDSEPITTEQEEPIKFKIENHNNRCRLYDESGAIVYSSSGSILELHGELYRISMTYSSLSINKIDSQGEEYYHTGARIIKASSKSELYKRLSDINDLGLLIENIRQNVVTDRWELLVDHFWYDENGNLLEEVNNEQENVEVDEADNSQEKPAEQEGISMDILSEYTPKGKIRHIRENVTTPYDYLLMLAITDFIHFEKPQTYITFDELSSMMIANAWEIEELQPDIKGKDVLLDQCIDYLIDESRNNMQSPLNLNSSKELIFQQIKDYPMSGPYEEAVDTLVEKAPFEVVNNWIKTNDLMELVSVSQTFETRNLYAIYYSKNPNIQINPSWIGNLHYDYDNLQAYFRALYIDYLQNHE